MNRRDMILKSCVIGTWATLGMTASLAQTAKRRQFTLDLCPGRIGVNADQFRTLQLASEYGFESIEPFGSFLAGLAAQQMSELLSQMKTNRIVWGAAGLPVDFRKDQATFDGGMSELATNCKALQLAGVSRVGTWLSPSHDELTYLANFKQHASRLRKVAKVLDDYGLRFGLEYVGPRTLWSSKRYPFVHTLSETQELIAEIGASNVGLVLDSWHWYTAEEDADQLLALRNAEVVAVDLNDAPAGISVREQIDNRRELPMASGVIDLKTFLRALVQIGYDGPVRAEPFNQKLNAMDDGPATEATASAMKKAFQLVG